MSFHLGNGRHKMYASGTMYQRERKKKNLKKINQRTNVFNSEIRCNSAGPVCVSDQPKHTEMYASS